MKRSLVLAGTALATVMSQQALAGGEEMSGHVWYLSAAAGANWSDSFTDIPAVTPTFTTAHGIDADTGWTVAASVGHRMHGNWRIEAELAGRWNDFDGGLSGPGTFINITGDLQVLAAMANVVVDIPMGEKFALMLGAGVGYAWASADFTISGSTGAGISTTSASEDDSGFAYQGIAGVSFDVGERSELFLEYRYFAVSGVDVFAPLIDEDADSHAVRVGLRFDMNGGE